MSALHVALVGNPNSGKTTLFNALTGSQQQTGNWPGVTVDKKTGDFVFQGSKTHLIDLPGIYTLDAESDNVSIDEQISRDYLLGNTPDLLLNVIDASHLERSLYLTVQLLEMGIPLVLVINKLDSALNAGIQTDTETLQRQLQCPVISISARKHSDIKALKQFTYDNKSPTPPTTLPVIYSDDVKIAAKTLGAPTQWDALRTLQHNFSSTEEWDIVIADQRYRAINKLHQQITTQTKTTSQRHTERIDKVVLHPFMAIPIFLLMMYCMFMFTINIGGSFIDFFDIMAGAIFVDELSQLLSSVNAPAWLIAVLTQGIGAGIQTVATFIPVVTALFLFMSFLEDSGYMVRAAFIVDKLMQSIGLPGKSFVPMMVGFGCNVPAIMATRTLDSRRDRLMTIAMTPFMSCGARLPVYVLFAAAFFPLNGQNIVLLMYVVGIAIAMLTGFILKLTLLPGNPAPFIMELPNYHLPQLSSVFRQTWQRLKEFIVDAGKIIVLVVCCLNLANSWDPDKGLQTQATENSYLAQAGKAITPIFSSIGIKEDNWPAAMGLLIGIFAKEAVIGVLDTLYSPSEEPTDTLPSLTNQLHTAAATIPENLSGTLQQYYDPLGISVGDLSDTQSAAEDQGVTDTTIKEIRSQFLTPIAAISYLLFILLYMPCVAVVGAVYREAGGSWAVFVGVWTTGMAWAVATTVYQLGTFTQHPGTSVFWLSIVALLAASTYISLTHFRPKTEATN